MRTVWIIDGNYLWKATPGRFNYLKLKAKLEQVNCTSIFESYYFNSTPNPIVDVKDNFHLWLSSPSPRGPDMRVKLHPLRNIGVTCPECNYSFAKKTSIRVRIAISSLIIKLAHQNHYDRLILSCGDGDLVDAIDYMKRAFKKRTLGSRRAWKRFVGLAPLCR